MFIQDPIHGYIRLEGLERDLLDTEEFQRLRRIKQLGFTNLVYPSTTHTRFEHSLGATYLAGKFADYLELDEDDREHLRAAAMLHDIGHGAYSHTSEMAFVKEGYSHEDFSVRKIREDSISGVLEEHGVSPDRVVSLVRGEGELGQIIAGDIDVDRMDYLMRDSHYSGVAHGTIDAETIMRGATFRDGRLVFKSKFRQALEGLLTARYLMIPTVYMHEGVIRAEKMMERAIDEYLDEEDRSARCLSEMDDIDLKYILRHTENERARYLNQCLDNRKVFKTALRFDRGDVGEEGIVEFSEKIRNERGLEARIASEAGVERKEVLVNSPSIPKKKELQIDILRKDSIINLEDLSKVSKAINDSIWDRVYMDVYSARDVSDEVGEAAGKVLKEQGLTN